MTFDTIEFCIFLPLLLLAFYMVPAKVRKYVLLLGNIIFYISLDWKVFCLAATTAIVTFYSGIKIENCREKQQKAAFCIPQGQLFY